MKKLLLTGLLTLAMGMAAHAVSFGYTSTAGSLIAFDGASHFSFTPATGSFSVQTGSATGDIGEITGTFTIGPITTVAGVSSAAVTGTGTFIIHDGANTFSASLVWNNIVQVGTGSLLNTVGSANLTGITYGGSNADLLAIKNSGSGVNTLSFQFSPTAVSLADLAGPGKHTTTFSGSVGAPDGGTTAALLGFALAGMATLRRTIKGSKA